MRFTRTRAVLGALTGAAVGRWVSHALPGAEWTRVAGDGRTVGLGEGIAAAMGVVAGAAAAGASGGSFAALAGAVAGAIDDHCEDRFPAAAKGFKGHLGALRHGQLTSGLAKICIIGTGGALAAAGMKRSGSGLIRTMTWGCQAALIAGTANAVNLLDLRPARALKGAGALALPLTLATAPTGPLAGAVLATGAVCFPEDAHGTTMLGDLGSNALGATLGYALAAAPAGVRWPALVVVVALNALSERYSFSRIIASTPWLAALDRWGRGADA
ncbi:hypothetical protein [Neoactinobaculum massilliense]|uniref:hypothetical protein n=1 Tax=Neoactinobaculum massilliense TaxID=2364794 RepID=UPI000F549854|nr:hypothetical protein [Neoactinobaculum massilliense]